MTDDPLHPDLRLLIKLALIAKAGAAVLYSVQEREEDGARVITDDSSFQALKQFIDMEVEEWLKDLDQGAYIPRCYI